MLFLACKHSILVMKSISSFDAMAIVNAPEHTDKPSLTIVTPCIEIVKLMERVMRGLVPAPPIGHDDFEMTTDQEYRDADMRDDDFVDTSDDSLVDMSNLMNNLERMRSKIKPKAAMPLRESSPEPQKKEDDDKPPKQPE